MEIFVSVGDSHYQAQHPTNIIRSGSAQQATALNNNSGTDINKDGKNAFGRRAHICDRADDVAQ